MPPRGILMAVFAFAALLTWPGEGQADTKERFAPHVATVMENETIASYYDQCPADIFEDRANLMTRAFGTTTEDRYDACKADLGGCINQCITKSAPGYCFYGALILQMAEVEVGTEASDRLFAFACAVGSAAGCTNRAAATRSGNAVNDALGALPEAEKDRCTTRSFIVACEHLDPWGCAMAGASYRLGLGTEKDKTAAAAAFDKACDLGGETFEACRAARRMAEFYRDE